MIFTKQFIQLADISPVYYFMPPTIRTEKLYTAILDAQNEGLQQILGETFYNSVMGLYGLNLVHSNIAAGAVTVFTVPSTSSLESGMYTRITGTVDNTAQIDLNNKFYQITVINSNTFSIAVDSTGSDFTGAFGSSSDYLLENDFNLRKNYIVPYLAKLSAAIFVMDSGRQSTRTGTVQKETKYSKPLEKDQTGNLVNSLQSSANTYADRLVKFLEKDKEDKTNLFPLYEEKTKDQQKVFSSSIGIKPSRQQKIDRLFRNIP